MILDIHKIRTDGGTQVRAVIDQDVVRTYADAMREHAKFPHITVFHDGAEYWLADGFHRLEALKLLGKDIAVVDAIQGSLREAILFSVGANSKHGLQRTKQDMHRAIETLLRDKEWGKTSDRWIAEKCGVHHETVTRVRAAAGELAANASSSRVGKDGKTRKLPTKRATSILPVGQGGKSLTGRPKTVLAQVTDTVSQNPRGALAAQRDGAPSAMPSTPQTSRSGRKPELLDGDPPWIEEVIELVLNEPLGRLVRVKARIVQAFEDRGLSLGDCGGAGART